jgi:hypothetical protein
MTQNFIQKLINKLQFTYPKASIKDVQATGEAFILKREHSELQKMKIITFFYFVGIFALLDPDPRIRIRIQGPH